MTRTLTLSLVALAALSPAAWSADVLRAAPDGPPAFPAPAGGPEDGIARLARHGHRFDAALEGIRRAQTLPDWGWAPEDCTTFDRDPALDPQS